MPGDNSFLVLTQISIAVIFVFEIVDKETNLIGFKISNQAFDPIGQSECEYGAFFRNQTELL